MKRVLLIIPLLCLFTQNLHALERFPIISTEQMQQMLTDREAGKIDFILVNALDEMIYRNSAIAGSINVPLGKAGDHIHKLGTDKTKQVITY
ncbi:MAG: hypothetical protein ABFS19_08710 [Thermodesulfobacteriota bacterium]